MDACKHEQRTLRQGEDPAIMSMNSERRILIEVGHPAHVHQFKHMFWELEKSGWKGLFVTKDKECALDLLKEYKLPYVLLGKTQNGTIRKLLSLPFFLLPHVKNCFEV